MNEIKMTEKLDSFLLTIEKKALKLDFSNSEVYTNWLAQTYFFVRHSTRLLALSAAYCPFELQSYHHRALEHAAEERSHEKLLESDLLSFGLKISELNEYVSTKKLYSEQYAWIQNHHALSFLGYVYILEKLAVTVGPKIFNVVSKKWGPKSSNFLRVHVSEDPEHLENLIKIFHNSEGKIQELIVNNCEQSAKLYCEFLEEIGNLKNFESKKAG